MKIQKAQVIKTSDRCEVTADDGHFIVASRYKTGFWALLNEFSSPPTRPYHFSLRKLVADTLNGNKQ